MAAEDTNDLMASQLRPKPTSIMSKEEQWGHECSQLECPAAMDA
jgi:hypothetical protein